MRKIIKAEKFTKQDLVKLENESIDNAHHFMIKFHKSHYDIRRNQNPFRISFEQMNKIFGEPNIVEDGGSIWILKYKRKLFSIHTGVQGSQVFKIFKKRSDNKNIAFDRDFSNEMESFYNQLFEQFKK